MMKLSDDVQEKLKGIKSDVKLCKTLADNGVDPEEFERTLPEEVLKQVIGGFESHGKEIICPYCGSSDGNHLSYQFFASIMGKGDCYRCTRRNRFFDVDNDGNVIEYE